MDYNPNLQNLSIKAEEIYTKIQSELENLDGKYVAIELNSGNYFIGDTREDAVNKARKKVSSDKILFVRRIGSIEKISSHICSPSLINHESSYACLF